MILGVLVLIVIRDPVGVVVPNGDHDEFMPQARSSAIIMHHFFLADVAFNDASMIASTKGLARPAGLNKE